MLWTGVPASALAGTAPASFDASLFAGLTAIVLTLLLALARASQGMVRDPGEDTAGPPQLPATLGDGGDGRLTHPDPVSAVGADDLVVPPQRPSDQVVAAAGEGVGDLSTATLLANVVLTQGIFGVLLLGAAVYTQAPPAVFGVTADPLSTGLPALAVGIALGVVLYVGNELGATGADAMGVEYDERLRELLAPETTRGWLVLLFVALPVVAGVEEFIFRAAVVGAVHAGFGTSPWALAVVSSLAFALGHGAQGRLGVLVTGSLGFVLAAAFILTGSFLVVFVAHYLVNALEFVVHELLEVEWAEGIAN